MLVCGGNTANLLAVWRVRGFDRVLREAWESGNRPLRLERRNDLLARGGVTDSFGPS
jgi:dipeptidase E